MLRNILPLVLFTALAGAANSQSIYLKLDEKCMNRLEFDGENPENPYITYSYKLGEKRFASFEVGVESKKWVKDLPGKTTTCSALKVDKELVKKVNNGTTKLYIVRESASDYHIASVDKANLLEASGGTLDFQTDNTDFSINLGNPVSGINLALPGSKSEVYLEGTITYQCLKGYILHKKQKSDSRSFQELVVVPELGVVETADVSKTGFVDDLTREHAYKLALVDGLSFRTALSELCDHLQASYYDKTTSNTGTAKPASYDNLTAKTGTTVPKSYGNDPCAPTNEPGVHVVQKGETLYAISRKYSVPVAQLASWNNLADGNVISLCQRLWVKQPSGTSTTTTTTTTTTTGTTEKGGETTTSSTGYWTKSTAEHQVRSGETVAGLAKMYGYTEERFRKMNGLSAGETVRPGQRLRTNDCNCPTLETSTKDTPLPYDQATETIKTTGETTPAKAIDNKDVYYRPITVHLVKSTDTWFSIAKQYNTSVERILELNGMTKDDKLNTDQRIYVQ